MRLLPLDLRPGRPVRGLRFAADGRSLAAVVGRPNDPRRRPVWFDLAAGGTFEPVPVGPDDRWIGDPAFGPDPRLFAGLSRSVQHSFVRLIDARDERPQTRQLDAAAWELFAAVGLSADGGTLFVGVVETAREWPDAAYDTGLRFARLDVANWLDAGDPDRIDEEVAGGEPAVPTAFADTGAGLLAVGTSAGTAVLRDLIAGHTLLTVEHLPGANDPPQVDAVLLSPDGRHLVTRAAGSLVVWDALTGRELARLDGPRPFADCAFTPDGRSLLAVGLDTGVSRFDAPRYTLAERLEFGHGALHSVAVAPDGLTAAAGTGHGAVLLFDL